MGREIRISITTGTIIKVLLVLVAAWALFYIRGTVLNILTAIVIASAIEPGVAGLIRRRIPRVIAVILVYLGIFSVFFLIFYFLLPSLLEDFATFVSNLPNYLDAFSRSGAFDQYAQILGAPSPSSLSSTDVMQSVRDSLSISSTFSNAFTAISTIFGGVFSFILIIVFSFYFAVLETGVDDFLQIIVPKKSQGYVLGLWRRSQRKIGQWMQGQLLLALFMAIMVYLALRIVGVPNAIMLALIAGIFEIIPVFGPTLAAIPAVGVAFAAGGIGMGLVTIGVYIIAQQFENHLIYPQVVTRIVGVPPLLVMLALIIGGELAGFIGVILAVPIAATVQELAKDIESGVLFGDAEPEQVA
jgi:predicted PurR-regulated permease PerM